MLLPLRMMWDRVELARSDSDTTLFLHLLYAGEMTLKLTTASMVSAVEDDRERHRYRLTHRLIRSDGLGDWAQTLDEILIGPPSQHLLPTVSEDRRSLTERCTNGTWQHEAVSLLQGVLSAVSPELDSLPTKVQVSRWFTLFSSLRNKTRAHGAMTPGMCAEYAPVLEKSVRLVVDNLPLFKRGWAYLHRNLSGKYRVIPLGPDKTVFDQLKKAGNIAGMHGQHLDDGVYIDFDGPVRVELLSTSVDVADFFLPNGGFKGRHFELLSLISDSRMLGDAAPYTAPSGERPASETEGRGALDLVGKAFTNLPPNPPGYVKRPELESELLRVLADDRHPVITLVGRGGIGKTSLALTALHAAAQGGLFEAIVWFSARDIDLLTEGPKVVAPQVLTEKDIAEEFVRLFGPEESSQKTFRAVTYLASSLTKSPIGGPILFVYDNFETVRHPGDLFSWLDTHVRLPNKVLITTRHREFKADYPIDVSGMTEDEAKELMDVVSARLGITHLVTRDYKAQVYEEADGHPYIVKVLLGEVAKAQRLVKVERIIAAKEEILDALFERTYASLSPVAKRVFLTLSGWRSLVPQMALEAILLRPGNEKMDVEAAIDELVRCSFIERLSATDASAFLDIALVASMFGRRKLEVSPMRAAIAADAEFLTQIGATSWTGLRHGVGPRIERLFQNVATRITQGRVNLHDIVPSLAYVCRQYAPGWLLLAKLHEEIQGTAGLADAAECVRQFVEHSQSVQDQRRGWDELGRLYLISHEWIPAAHAIVRACESGEPEFSRLSNAANTINTVFRNSAVEIDSDERRVVVGQLAELMESRVDEATATDRSRLAWLYLYLKDPQRARVHAEYGLNLDSENEHCLRLVERLDRRVGRGS